MRASDSDRDHVISALQEAFAEGRLDHDELDARLTSAQTAKTYGELDRVVADLPVAPPTAAIPAVPPVRQTPVTNDESGNVGSRWAVWLGVAVLVNVIWFATWVTSGHGPSYYWPIWVMGPWGAVLLLQWLVGRNDGS